jgi:hypothetical protein
VAELSKVFHARNPNDPIPIEDASKVPPEDPRPRASRPWSKPAAVQAPTPRSPRPWAPKEQEVEVVTAPPEQVVTPAAEVVTADTGESETPRVTPAIDPEAIRAHIKMLHERAADAKEKGGESVEGRLVLVRFEGETGAPKTERFKIGDHENMVKAAIAWAGNPNLNLYAPWAILRPDLEANKKGAETDVIRVLAFVGDLDADTGKAGGPLPVDAPYILETSAGNFQPVFPLATALLPNEAKPLAIALADAVGCDHRTKDISGIWRIPGTLNWPTKTKLGRGRSPEPQLVKVSTPWTGELIVPEKLAEALPKKAKSAANEQQHQPKTVSDLFKSLSAVEKKALAASAYQGEDQNETAASFASRMRARGLTDPEIQVLIQAFPSGLGERYASRGKDLEADLRRMRAKWEEETATTLFDPWDRYSVPTFPLEVLPASVADFVKSDSAVIGCDPSALAMTALVAISAALDHRFALKMMRNGSWWASPRLWVLLVGDPSRKKTPAINSATRELEVQQNALREEYEGRKKLHLAAGGDPKDGPAPPPRFVVFDSTVEKLGEMLARYDRGLLVKRDEFATRRNGALRQWQRRLCGSRILANCLRWRPVHR